MFYIPELYSEENKVDAALHSSLIQYDAYCTYLAH